MSGSPLFVVAGVVAFLIAFACAVGALVRREEDRGHSGVGRDEARSAAKRVRGANARRARAQTAQARTQKPPAEAEDPLLTLYLRDYSGPR